jgi:hypothetical protein
MKRSTLPSGFLALALATWLMFPLDCAAWALWEFKPFPLEQLSSTVKVGEEKIGGMSMPPGAYIAKDQRIVVFNYYGGPPNPMAQGVIGTITDTVAQNARVTKRFAPLIASVTFDLKPATQAAIEKHAATLAARATSTDTVLSISPFAFFVQEQPGAFRIRVLLQATLTGKGGKKLWTNQYYCPGADVRPLEGEESWFVDDRYGRTAVEAIERTMPFVFKDVLGELTPGRQIKVTTGVTWNARIERTSKVLYEDEGWLATRVFRDGTLGDDVDLVDKRNAEITDVVTAGASGT